MTVLLSERRDGVCILTLNRPEKMNALSAELVQRLTEEVERCHHDGTRLLVLRGNGRNFSAGFDFTGHEDEGEASLVLRFIRIEALLQAVHHAPFDTVALAHGPTMGAGADLFCACARRVAAPDCRFRMPGLRFGLVLGTRRLAQRVGHEAARRLLAATRWFDAEEARTLAFADAIREPDRWDGLIQNAAGEAMALDPETRRRLYSITTPDTRDRDMSDLVRSAARAGLKDRLKAYLEARK